MLRTTFVSPSSPTVSRRRFFQVAGSTTLALAAAPKSLFAAPYIRTQDKSGTARPITGNGKIMYECIHDWLTPPTGILWGDTHGLAQDAQGRIYVAHTVHPESAKPFAIVVFDRDGEFITAWGEEFRGGAHGLDIRAEAEGEFLYHCDINRRIVVKTDLDGRVVWQAEYPKASGFYEAKEKYCPTNVCFLPAPHEGDVLVADGYGSSYVHRYTSAGEYVKTIIKPGKDKGQVNCPHGLWIDGRDGEAKLVIADRGNRRIQYFTLEGEHLGFVPDPIGGVAGSGAPEGKAGIRMPCHIKTRGDLLLVPDLESVVTILDKQNRVVVQLGDGHPSDLRGQPRDKFIPGKFIHPHTAIWLAGAGGTGGGDILVAEWVPIGRVTKLRKVLG